MKTKAFKTVVKGFLFLLFVGYFGNRPRSVGVLWEFFVYFKIIIDSEGKKRSKSKKNGAFLENDFKFKF